VPIRSFIPDKVIEFFLFDLPNPSSHTMALSFTQPATEISTISFSGCGGKVLPACNADNLTAICLENVESSKSHNLIGLHTCHRDSFTFYLGAYPTDMVYGGQQTVSINHKDYTVYLYR
jgi:hypothetical protein